MAKVFINREISGKGRAWSAKNGATRRELVLIVNDKDFPNGLEGDSFEAKVGWLDKGNHSFIFINKAQKLSDKVIGIFLNSKYAYQVYGGKELFSNYSIGGYGNSCSQFGIYTEGTIIEENTYKNRRPKTYWALIKKGWVCLGTQANIMASLSDPNSAYVAEKMGWTQCPADNCIE